MSGIQVDSRSLRSEKLRANAPRAAFYVVVAILSLAGLRAIFIGPPERVDRSAVPSTQADAAVQSFAEAFARAYLSWDSFDLERREQQLERFTSSSLADGGVEPAEDSTQSVGWTSVIGIRPERRRTLVTLVAEVGADLVYLSVPIARNGSGELYVTGYPAFVGPPMIDDESDFDDLGAEVEEPELRSVALRAVANYLEHDRRNLDADLTPDATVTLTTRPLTVTEETFGDADSVTWVVTGRRVAVLVEAEDASGTTWTLRYELEVRRSDRWYVRAIHVDLKSTGGTK